MYWKKLVKQSNNSISRVFYSYKNLFIFIFFCSSSSHTSRKSNRVKKTPPISRKNKCRVCFCLKLVPKRTVKGHFFPSNSTTTPLLPELEPEIVSWNFFVIWICGFTTTAGLVNKGGVVQSSGNHTRGSLHPHQHNPHHRHQQQVSFVSIIFKKIREIGTW